MSKLTGSDSGGETALGEENGGLGGGVSGESLPTGVLDGGLRRGVGVDTGQLGQGVQAGPTKRRYYYFFSPQLFFFFFLYSINFVFMRRLIRIVQL